MPSALDAIEYEVGNGVAIQESVAAAIAIFMAAHGDVGYGYRRVVESMQRYFPDVVFIPSMTAGATDAHRYEEICDTCLRCSPFMTEPAEAASGVHGTNERLLVRSYLQGIRVLIDLMEHANVEP